jgi:hypothetical protein
MDADPSVVCRFPLQAAAAVALDCLVVETYT